MQHRHCPRVAVVQAHPLHMPVAAVVGRHMLTVVNVRKNAVEQAWNQLSSARWEASLQDEVKKREWRRTSQEDKFMRKRLRFNADMGHMVRNRLKWVMRRLK